MAGERAPVFVTALVVLTACRGGLPGDPGLTFTIDNRCGLAVEAEVSLSDPSTPLAEDWVPIPDGQSVRLAGPDAEPDEFVVAVRRAGSLVGVVELVPSSAIVTLTPASGCPA